jgi:hypothetical protein
MNMGVNHDRMASFVRLLKSHSSLFTSNDGILVLGLTPVGRDAIGMRHFALRGYRIRWSLGQITSGWKSLNQYS